MCLFFPSGGRYPKGIDLELFFVSARTNKRHHHQRVRSGRATFLIKVKSHRGEPIYERADTLAEKGQKISDDDKRWDDKTDQMTFEVRKGDTPVLSVWTNSVRNVFQKQAGWAKLQEARAASARRWTEHVWYRHNQRGLQALTMATAEEVAPVR